MHFKILINMTAISCFPTAQGFIKFAFWRGCARDPLGELTALQEKKRGRKGDREGREGEEKEKKKRRKVKNLIHQFLRTPLTELIYYQKSKAKSFHWFGKFD